MGVCRYPHTKRVVLKTQVPQTARPDRVEKKDGQSQHPEMAARSPHTQ